MILMQLWTKTNERSQRQPTEALWLPPSAIVFKENSQEQNFHQSFIQLTEGQSFTTVFDHKAISLEALKQMKRISSKAKSKKNIKALPENRFGNYLLISNVATKRHLPRETVKPSSISLSKSNVSSVFHCIANSGDGS